MGDAVCFFPADFAKSYAEQLTHKENRMKKLLRVFLVIPLVALMALLALPYFASATILYTNGPINGGLGGVYLAAQGYYAADSFSLSGTSTITGANFGSWDTYATDTPSSVNWAITTAPVGGTTLASGTGSISFTYLYENHYAPQYYVYQDSFSIPSTTLPGGTYWFQLSGLLTSPYITSVFWDINNGPSMAYLYPTPGYLANAYFSGSDSDSFQILGTPTVIPLPPSVWLLGSGLVGLLGLRRFRK